MVFYTFGKCFSMDCYCLIHFCGERKIRLRYIFSYNKSYSRPTSFTTTYIFFIHAVGLFYILPYTQSDSRPTSFRTTYIFSYTQSVTCIFLHTHDRRLSGQRIFFHTHNRTLVYFFIHTVGLITAGPRKVNFPFKILLWKLHFRTNRGVGITAGRRKVNFPFKILL